jgi:hypothetical protein
MRLYKCMGIEKAGALGEFATLRKTYDDAFCEFCREVRNLQLLMGHPAVDTVTLYEARRRVERAQRKYRESRDLLAQFLLLQTGGVTRRQRPGASAEPLRGKPGDEWGDGSQRSRIERLAYQIWEQTGRPSGKAEEHWYSAEQSIRRQP